MCKVADPSYAMTLLCQPERVMWRFEALSEGVSLE